jgi:hypothetical protein
MLVTMRAILSYVLDGIPQLVVGFDSPSPGQKMGFEAPKNGAVYPVSFLCMVSTCS